MDVSFSVCVTKHRLLEVAKTTGRCVIDCTKALDIIEDLTVVPDLQESLRNCLRLRLRKTDHLMS